MDDLLKQAIDFVKQRIKQNKVELERMNSLLQKESAGLVKSKGRRGGLTKNERDELSDLLIKRTPLMAGGIQYVPGAGVGGATEIVKQGFGGNQTMGGKLSMQQMAQRYKPAGQSFEDFMNLWKSVLRNRPYQSAIQPGTGFQM